MQKIMFNDRYGLTQAVLDGRKTMTRRIAEKVLVEDENGELRWNGEFKTARFTVGEIVAVAQSLRDMGYNPRSTKHRSGAIWGLDHTPGWSNKMFVCATECMHQIRITDVRRERLQDITEEDCLREGICKADDWIGVPAKFAFDVVLDHNGFALAPTWYTSARGAFAGLIDKVSGKGTWSGNPWVYVYTFEKVR